jgi:hypothetical protein
MPFSLMVDRNDRRANGKALVDTGGQCNLVTSEFAERLKGIGARFTKGNKILCSAFGRCVQPSINVYLPGAL